MFVTLPYGAPVTQNFNLEILRKKTGDARSDPTDQPGRPLAGDEEGRPQQGQQQRPQQGQQRPQQGQRQQQRPQQGERQQRHPQQGKGQKGKPQQRRLVWLRIGEKMFKCVTTPSSQTNQILPTFFVSY